MWISLSPKETFRKETREGQNTETEEKYKNKTNPFIGIQPGLTHPLFTPDLNRVFSGNCCTSNGANADCRCMSREVWVCAALYVQVGVGVAGVVPSPRAAPPPAGCSSRSSAPPSSEWPPRPRCSPCWCWGTGGVVILASNDHKSNIV